MPDDAPPTEFSSGRALKHLRVIAARPHPTGSLEHGRVREYILKELAAQGLQPEVQQATGVLAGGAPGRPVSAATVRNVLARLRGTQNSRALMLAAHYDSVPTAPGATDDGAGVVALLETLRALRAGAPPRNDIIFLFTDGEELGLLGAEAFAREHPWMREVALVLNFEGRGHAGPSLMFETSDGNGWLVGEMARAAPYPVANSLMYSLYKRLPNDTDMTVFKRAGAAGLNFAYADGVTHYHTMLDTADELDERSLQHQGSYALALARHFGGLDLRDTRARDAVYFNAFGRAFVRYPEAWVAPLTAAATLLFAGVILLGLRNKRLSIGGIAAGFLALLLCMAGAYALGLGFVRALPKLHPGFESLPSATPYNSGYYETGLVLVALGLTAAAYAWLGSVRAESLSAGAMLWWLLLLLLTTFALPAGTFLFAWPLLFSLVGLACALAAGEDFAPGWKGAAVAAFCAAPVVALVAPLIYMLFMLLGLGLPQLLLVLAVLLAGLLVPVTGSAGAARWWLVPMFALIVGAGLILAGAFTAGYDAHRRKTDSAFYFMNADTNRARWVSADASADEWTSQFFREGARRESVSAIFPWVSQAALQAEAPAIDAPPPGLEVLEDRSEGGVRAVRVRLTSPRGAPLLMVYADAETEVLSASVNGRPVAGGNTDARGGAGKFLRLSYAAPPAEGLELSLEVNASRPLKLVVQDISYELPQVHGFDIRPRPAHLMPSPSIRASDTTIISKSFALENR